MDNFDEIVERLKASLGFTKNEQLAELFGLSPPDFSKRKKTGTLLPILTEWAINNRVNLNWLLIGIGPESLEPEKTTPIHNREHLLDPTLPKRRITDKDIVFENISLGGAVEQLAKIFASGDTVLVRAISANLHAFSETVDIKARETKTSQLVANMSSRMELLEQQIKVLVKKENEALQTTEEEKEKGGGQESAKAVGE